MNPVIEEIVVPNSISDHFSGEQPFDSLRGIKRLNAFVGPNNSGKSRLMRSIFKSEKNMLVSTNQEGQAQIREAVRNALRLLDELQAVVTLNLGDTPEKVRSALQNCTIGFAPVLDWKVAWQQQTKELQNYGQRFQQIANSQQDSERQSLHALGNALKSIPSLTSRLSNPNSHRHNQQPEPPPFQQSNFVYIPTLRGMRVPFERDDAKFTYFDRTWNDYFADDSNSRQSDSVERIRKSKSGSSIVTGLDLFDVVTDHLLGSLKDRKFIRNFERFLSKSFFEGQPVALIPRKDGDTLHVKIGNEAERPIERLGDGIQQLMILTLPIFQHRDQPLFLFIEEPDMFLHPGFQQVFIDLVTKHENPDLYVFVTTHSQQFLDVTLDEDKCAIFRCSKDATDDKTDELEPAFTVERVARADTDLLRYIGVRPSSVLFANCTIWVEGITDRLFFGRYLELEIKKRGLRLIENLHYAFVEYGGGNITHWSFLDEEGMDVERICSQLFLLSDQDENKDERHKKLADKLGERFYCLKVREVENLLTPEIITSVIYDYEREEIELNHFTQSNYSKSPLGSFIDNKVLPDKTKSKRHGKLETCYADKSGTVKDKVNFCRKALLHLNDLESLSNEARSIAETLCNFVKAENDCP